MFFFRQLDFDVQNLCILMWKFFLENISLRFRVLPDVIFLDNGDDWRIHIMVRMAPIWWRHENHVHIVMGLGSGQVRVPKKSGFHPGFWILDLPTTSLLIGSGSKSWVWVGFGYQKCQVCPLGFGFSGTWTHHNVHIWTIFHRPKKFWKTQFYNNNDNTDLREHFARISWTGHLHLTKATIFRSGGQRPKSNCPFMRPIPAMMIEAIKHWVVQIVLRWKTGNVITARAIIASINSI